MKKNKRIIESMIPKDNFINFRDNLKKELGDNPLSFIDILSVLKLLVTVSEDILTKEGKNKIEELALVEFCLSVSMSLLLSDQELLNKAILTEEIKILKEGTSFKLEGVSDFVSYIMNGMLGNKTIFVNNFYNCFNILMREAHNKEIQKVLLHIILSNILKDDNTSR